MCARDLARLALVGQKHVYEWKSVVNPALPTVNGIVVGVERNGQACGFELAKKLRYARLQSTLQVERRKMEMTGIGKIFEVEILEGQFANGSEITHHIAPIVALKHDGDSGFCVARNTLHSGDVYADTGEALHGNLPERVVPDTSDKTDATAQRGQIVGGIR